MADNAFARIADWPRAQELADGFSPDRLHAVLDRYAAMCCPVLDVFGQTYHWEPDAGGLFHRSGLSLCDHARPTLRTAHPGVGAQRQSRADRYFPGPSDHCANWLRNWAVGSRPGSKGPASSIASAAPRSTWTTSSVVCCVSKPRPTTCPSSSTTARWNIRDGPPTPPTRAIAPVKKTIYSLIDLRGILLACNRRYLAHLSALNDFCAGVRALEPAHQAAQDRRQSRQRRQLLRSGRQRPATRPTEPENQHAGLRRADLAPLLNELSPSRLSRQLHRLREIGVIKNVAGTYRVIPRLIEESGKSLRLAQGWIRMAA